MAGFLSVLLFVTNSVLAHSSESNLWKERNKTRNNVSLLLQSLPQSYGTPRKVVALQDLNAERIVLHIQDVHLNPEAQTNIDKTVQSLIQNGQVDLIALEGAFAPIDLSHFRNFHDQTALHEVVDYLFRENKISGPIHAALTSSRSLPPIVGIDDAISYQANIDAYRQASLSTQDLKEKLSKLKERLTPLKPALFNPDLLKFDEKVQAYREGKLPWGDYVRFLAQGNLNLPWDIETFLTALEMESRLDTARIEIERSDLIGELVKKMSDEEASDLMKKSVAYRLGKIGPHDFYKQLKDLCERKGLLLSSHKAMNAYIQYVFLSENIDADKLLAAVKKLEEEGFSNRIKMHPTNLFRIQVFQPEEGSLIAYNPV